MTGSASEINQASFGKHVNAVTVGKGITGDGTTGNGVFLDNFTGNAFHRFEFGDLYLVVEVPDVANDSLILHAAHVIDRDNVLVARCGHEDIRNGQGLFHGGDLVTGHTGLESANGVDFRNHYPSLFVGERLGRTFADVTESAHHGDLA